MNCTKCGAALPPGARFCFACGQPVAGAAPAAGASVAGAAAPPSTPASPTLAPVGAQEIKCPACGAPLKPVFGEMVITCDYCGGSVTLGGAGWKEIAKHSMLPLKVQNVAAALEVVRANLDVGLLHRKAFEDSKIVEQKLSFVPFWVLPVSGTANYQYQDVAVGVGSTVATVVGAEALGSLLGGRRGGFVPVPILTGPTVNPTRQKEITHQYEYPVIAVKSMTMYQPRDYQFALSERTYFDRKQIPDGAPILNGDLGEDAAQHSARAFVTQLLSEEAHKQHSMVSHLTTQVDTSEGELLHVPVYYFQLDRKGERSIVLVDGHAGRVIQTVA